MKRILIVEDETAIREFEAINLKRVGYNVVEAGSGEEALDIYDNDFEGFDIALLDISMPGIDGFTLCKELRQRSETLGIIMLTARTQEMDKISGLMMGADDYITKPFSPTELLARVDSLYRRVEMHSKKPAAVTVTSDISLGDFTLNLRRRTLLKNGKNIMPVVVGGAAKTPLPKDLEAFSNRNFISFDQTAPIEEFVTRLELGFSEETKENREYNTLMQELRDISDEQDNDFNIKVRKLIMKHDEETVEKKLLPLIKAMKEPDLCFTAYYAAFTFYRRLGYVYKIHDLVDHFNEQFKDYRFNNIILSQHYSTLFQLEGHKPEDLRKAIEYARIALEKIPENSGVMQNYADLITKGFEMGVMGKRKDKEQLAYAIGRIENALKINPGYPKYHCTLGRLLSFKNRFDEAIMAIEKAISLENMETKDSFIRIVEYNKYIFDIKLRKVQSRVQNGFFFTGAMLGILAVLWILGRVL